MLRLSGVQFKHFGELIRVRGGNLKRYIGHEVWAVVDGRMADCVTFMTNDFGDVFTEPLRPVVNYDESENDRDSGALKKEYETKAEHRHVIEDQYHGLLDRFGDPRVDLLQQAQKESQVEQLAAELAKGGRLPTFESPNLIVAGVEGERQRAALRRKQTRLPVSRAKRIADANDIKLSQDTVARPGIDDAAESIFGGSSSKKTYLLKPSASQHADYIAYLLQRLTEFRRAGGSFGQKHLGEISVHVTRKIVQSQLGWPLEDTAHFEETCAHLKAKINNTILGKRNTAAGKPSYHSFADHGQEQSK